MKKNIWNIIKYVIIVLGVIISGYLIKVIKDLDVLPNKYFIIMIIGLVICNAICILCITRKKLLPKILSIILYVVMFIVSFIGINYGKDTISFLDNSFDNNNVEITNYSIITLDSSDTEKKEDLKGKKVGYFVIDGQDSDYIEKIKKETDCELIEYKNSYELYEALLNKEIDAIVIDDAYLDILEEEYEDIDKKIKVIDTYEIEKKVDKRRNTPYEDSTHYKTVKEFFTRSVEKYPNESCILAIKVRLVMMKRLIGIKILIQ